MNESSRQQDKPVTPDEEQGSSPETRRAGRTSAENSATDALGMAGTHPLGTAVGGIGGAMAGAVAGIAAGPVGSLAGAIAGAIGGGLLGSGAAMPPTTGPVVQVTPEDPAEDAIDGGSKAQAKTAATRSEPANQMSGRADGSSSSQPIRPATPATAPGDEAAPGTPGTGEDACPECGGSGRAVGGQPCAHCAGSGKVIVGIGGA